MAEEKQALSIELPENVSETYANLVLINHSPSEFVLDFISIMPGTPKAKVKSRVILAPEHAKSLLSALAENVSRYEANIGMIEAKKPINAQDGGDNLHLFGAKGEA